MEDVLWNGAKHQRKSFMSQVRTIQISAAIVSRSPSEGKKNQWVCGRSSLSAWSPPLTFVRLLPEVLTGIGADGFEMPVKCLLTGAALGPGMAHPPVGDPLMWHAKVTGNRSPYDGDWVYWSRRRGHYPTVPTRGPPCSNDRTAVVPIADSTSNMMTSLKSTI